MENATSFAFSKSSNAIAIRKPKTKGAEHAGSALIVHNLNSNLDHHLGSVSSYEINKPGTLLAYTRDAVDKTCNGLYVMDLASGLQTPLDPDAATYSQMTWDEGGTALVSPDSKYFVFWRNANIWVYDLDSRTTLNLTKNAAVSFADQDYDYFGEKPPYGLAGWSKDGKHIILNHRYDLWLQPLNGDPAINLTGGDPPGQRDATTRKMRHV